MELLPSNQSTDRVWLYTCKFCKSQQFGNLAGFMMAHAHGISADRWPTATTRRSVKGRVNINLPEGLAKQKGSKEIYGHRPELSDRV